MDPIPALSKALGQVAFHKGMERPVPTLLKALGQAPPFPYGERDISVLPKALGHASFHKGTERLVPALVSPFPYEKKHVPALLEVLG